MHHITKSLLLFWIILFFISFSFVVYGQQGAKEIVEKNYEQAKKNFDADPNEENTIWLGRRTVYLGKYREAIEIYTQGLKKFPHSYKLYRHRGHRYITTRKFKTAVKDFKKAAEADLNNSPF